MDLVGVFLYFLDMYVVVYVRNECFGECGIVKFVRRLVRRLHFRVISEKRSREAGGVQVLLGDFAACIIVKSICIILIKMLRYQTCRIKACICSC